MLNFRQCLAAAAVLVGLAGPASAWSHKEHIQFTRLAAMRIVNDPAAPADLKAWLRDNVALLPDMAAEREWFLHESIGEFPDASKLSGLTWWAIVPDVVAQDRSNKTSEPAGLPERVNHFIDLEFFNPVNEKKTYQLDLSSLPTIEQVPNDIKNETYRRAGYLPLARANAYDKLVAAIKEGRLAPKEGDESQDHALKWAGYLVHYTQDNTQPHHSTMDYKSAQYFKGTKNTPNVHAEMEYRMADDKTQPLPELREQFWTEFEKQLNAATDSIGDADRFTDTLRVAMKSYQFLPLIGEAAKASADLTTDPKKPTVDTAKFFAFRAPTQDGELSVLEMKAKQTAWAIVRTENVLRQAWKEAKGKAPQSPPTKSAP